MNITEYANKKIICGKSTKVYIHKQKQTSRFVSDAEETEEDPFCKIRKIPFYYSIHLFMLSLPQKKIKIKGMTKVVC
jgi:hypothetical protein